MDNTKKVFIGFLAGLTVGSIAAILLAPDKGENTRNNIVQKSNQIKEDLNSSLQKGLDKINSVKESAFTLVNNYGNEIADKTNHNVNNNI
jgi:gas vesicle protein